MILATLCYIKHNCHTLMVYRNEKPNDIHEGKWNGLGGKFEPGESPEECVIREVWEESGLNIRNPKLRGLLMFPNFKGHDWYVFVFTAREFNGELIDSPGSRLQRLDLDDLYPLEALVKVILLFLRHSFRENIMALAYPVAGVVQLLQNILF